MAMERAATRLTRPRLELLDAPELDFEPDPFNPQCPTRVVLDMIGNKWTVLVIGALEQGTLSFGEIQARVGRVTPKVLTAILRGLERDGIVSRRTLNQVPRRVEYTLTPMGRTLVKPLGSMRRWAEDHVKDILVARQSHEGAKNGRARAGP